MVNGERMDMRPWPVGKALSGADVGKWLPGRPGCSWFPCGPGRGAAHVKPPSTASSAELREGGGAWGDVGALQTLRLNPKTRRQHCTSPGLHAAASWALLTEGGVVSWMAQHAGAASPWSSQHSEVRRGLPCSLVLREMVRCRLPTTMPGTCSGACSLTPHT